MADYEDYQTQQAAIDRQRKVAEMLMNQSMTQDQGQMVSGHYVAPSNLSYLAKILQGVVGNSNQAALDKQQSALRKSMDENRIGAIQRYTDLSQGKPAVPAQVRAQSPDMVGPPELSSPAQPAIAPNMRAAAMELLRSQDPSLRDFGTKQLLQKPEQSKFSTTPHYDQQGRAFVMNEQGAIKYLDGVQARDEMSVGPSGQVYNKYRIKEGDVLADVNKPFAASQNGPIPNKAYQDYEFSKAKAGKTDVNVSNKTEVKMGESLAGQVGPMMKDSSIAANGAVQQIDAANRIINAIDKNNIYAGPGASTRLKIAQVGDMLGVGGADIKEKIANTRQAIRGLAEMTLQGRKQMRGEGQITENEGKLAEKANSGDIDDLTPAEIKQLANASSRAAKYVVNEHNRKVGVMSKTTGLEGVVPFYEPITIQQENKPSESSGQFKIIGVR